MTNQTNRGIFIALLAALTALLFDMLVLEYLFFKVKRFRIGKKAGAMKNPVKILHLADLHLTVRLSWKYRKLAKRINKINPDIIFISGDSIDRDGSLEPLEQFLRLVKYSIPKVAILGNHEYLSGINFNKLRQLYRRVNGSLLINESVAYRINGIRLMVTGLDDLLEGEENFRKAVKDVSNEAHHFVLIHSPKHQEKIQEQIAEINGERDKEAQLNIYAMFAGHNHGGQVRIGGFVPHLPPLSGDYIEGWYNNEKPYMYLSKGFGSSKIPMRLGARSEIALFEYCP